MENLVDGDIEQFSRSWLSHRNYHNLGLSRGQVIASLAKHDLDQHLGCRLHCDFQDVSSDASC